MTELKKVGPFTPGVNTRRDDFDLMSPDFRSRYLRLAYNIDIRGNGKLRRRQGFAQQLAGSDCHSLYSPPSGSGMYYVDGNILYYATPTATGLTKTVVRTNVTPGLPLSYADMAGTVVYSDSVYVGMLSGAVDTPLNLPPIANVGVLAAGGAGGMPGGLYQASWCYENSNTGQLGPATLSQQVAITDGGSLVITGLPTSFPSNATALNIYLTPPDGDQLFNAVTLSTPISTYTFTAPPVFGHACQTTLLQGIPGGNIIRYLNGRLASAFGNLISISEPYSTLYAPMRGYIPLPSTVTLMEPCHEGWYVGTRDQIWWLDKNFENMVSKQTFGALPRSAIQLPEKNSVAFMTRRGIAIGNDQGEITLIQDDAVTVPAGRTGATGFRRLDGMKTVIASIFGAQPNVAAAQSYMTAEVVDKVNP